MAEETIDSFKFLLSQVEKDIVNLFSDVRDVFALLGAYYVTKKVCIATSNVIEAINVHFVCQFTSNKNWTRKYGPWAVVTGGSDGIGQAYAKELAKRGLNVILVSRSEEKLLKAKADIERVSDVEVEHVVADFASENQTQLYADIEEQLAGREIGLLVNNVGVMYDHPDVLLNISSDKLWQLMTINVGAATRMTHMLLPRMVERGRGGVVVLSSSSAALVTPGMTVYAATKKYLDYFLQGVAYEYRHSGVTFQSLIPFYVSTKMTSFSDRLTACDWLVPPAARYVESAVSTLGHTSLTTGYFPHTIQLWLSSAVPQWLWMWGAMKLNNSLRNEAIRKSQPDQSSQRGASPPVTFGTGVSSISAESVLSAMSPGVDTSHLPTHKHDNNDL